eukprot:2121766-Prymnesium_polylepis.2
MSGCRLFQLIQTHPDPPRLRVHPSWLQSVVALPMFRVGGRATPCCSRLGADGSEPAGCVSCASCAVVSYENTIPGTRARTQKINGP